MTLALIYGSFIKKYKTQHHEKIILLVFLLSALNVFHQAYAQSLEDVKKTIDAYIDSSNNEEGPYTRALTGVILLAEDPCDNLLSSVSRMVDLSEKMIKLWEKVPEYDPRSRNIVLENLSFSKNERDSLQKECSQEILQKKVPHNNIKETY